MRKSLLFVLTFAVSASVFGQAPSAGQDVSRINGDEPPMAGIQWIRGFDPIIDYASDDASGDLRLRRANLIYHGGPIMVTSVSKAIFWGPSWNNSTFVGDKINGLNLFHTGISSSNYAKTGNEYTGSNGQVTAVNTHQGHLIDTTAAANGSFTAAILAEVCKVITAPVTNGYYPVYTDVTRGSAPFCAYHSVGTCGGVSVQFAFFFNLDGDASCDPADTSGKHSQGLAALANVSGHEMLEARTDPALNAWFDRQGQENADKCAWTFNVPLVTFPNGSQWKIQGEWSNAAFTANTGYPNKKGQKGCIDGH